MQITRRFRRPFCLTLISSFVALGLAIGPNAGGRYDPSLAVLTATLIAVLWYSFFAYCSLFKSEISTLRYEIRGPFERRRILVEVENTTRERRIAYVCRLSGWRNGEEIPIPELLQGNSTFTLRPGEKRSADFVQIAPLRGNPGSPFGVAVEAGEPREAILLLELSWTDDLGETRTEAPEYWALGLDDDCTVRRYQLQEGALAMWTKLGGSKQTPELKIASARLSRRWI